VRGAVESWEQLVEVEQPRNPRNLGARDQLEHVVPSGEGVLRVEQNRNGAGGEVCDLGQVQQQINAAARALL
jgi:hypothetical protein